MSVAQVLRIARELQYRPLPELIGRRVEMTSIASIEGVLRELVSMYLPLDARWQSSKKLEGALAKYGLIDTELAAPEHLLETPDTQRGVELLKELGFVEDRAELPEEFSDDDVFCFEQLIKDLDARSCVLKLFLRDEIPFEVHFEQLAEVYPRLVVPANYFPREFVVIDACITNASCVWSDKHFYS